MSWFNQNARRWRIIILILLVLTFIGPWAYDSINVPAQYECSPPNFRLEGDFCGMPLPGVWAVAVSFGAIFTTLAGGADATLSVLLMRLLFGLAVFLTPLPIFSSIFLLSAGEQSWPQARHVKIWGLAVVGGLVFFSGFHFCRDICRFICGGRGLMWPWRLLRCCWRWGCCWVTAVTHLESPVLYLVREDV